MSQIPNRTSERNRAVTKHLLIAPPLLFFALLSLFPLLLAIYFSLTNMTVSGVGSWIGGANYQRAASDPTFLRSLTNTVIFAVVGVTLQYVLGLGLAILVNGARRGQRAFRLAFLVPFMVAPLVAGFVWTTLLDTRFGPVNQVITALGGPAVPWLTDPMLVFISIVIVDTWQWTPFMFLILFTALRTLPVEPFEAARVDGANAWRVFRDVTFPMLLPATIGVLLLRSIEAMKLFDIVYYMTAGGPANATSTLSLLAYYTGPQSDNYGYAAAISVVLLVMVMAFGMLMPVSVALLTRGRRDKAERLAIAYVAENRGRVLREAVMDEL